MGFRTSLITTDYSSYEMPQWFVDKYDYLNFGQRPTVTKKGLSLSVINERKFYYRLKETELFIDIQKVLIELELDIVFQVVLLHECGGITLVHITNKTISGREPTEWKEVDRVEHNYCYTCSLPDNLKKL